MTLRLAISGFGRIGRMTLRAVQEMKRSDMEVVLINSPGPVETSAHLYEFDSVHGRASQTRWHLIETTTTGSRLEIRPITGRSHQIRLHLATLGHPILGDPLYANQAAFAAADRLLLHARDLQLAHPDTGQTISWQSACPF